MGQQQLLLLVLSIIIVGLAVVVGIDAFSENRIKANADALVGDAMRIASDIQVWALKPEQVGGGGGTADAITALGLLDSPFEVLGYGPSGGGECGESAPSETYSNVNGCFVIAPLVCPDAEPSVDEGQVLAILALNFDSENVACINVTGTRSENIGTLVYYEALGVDS